MAKKFYIGLVLITVLVFLLNNLFMRETLEESYQKASMTKMVEVLVIAASRVQQKLINERKLNLSQYKAYLGDLVELFTEENNRNENVSSIAAEGKADIQLAVTNRLGMVIASSVGSSSWTNIPAEIFSPNEQEIDKSPNSINSPHKSDGLYYVYTPLERNEGENIGYLVLSVTPEFTKEWVDGKLAAHHTTQLQIGLAGLIFVLFFTFMFVRDCRCSKGLNKKIYFGVSSSVTVVLSAVLLLNGILYQKNYYFLMKENAQSYANNLNTVQIEDHSSLEQVLTSSDKNKNRHTVSKLHDHYNIAYSQKNGESGSRSTFGENDTSGSINKILLFPLKKEIQAIPVSSDSSNQVPHPYNETVVRISTKSLLDETRNYIVSGTTLFLVSILLLVELVYLLVVVTNNTAKAHGSGKQKLTDYMRPAMFFFLLGIDISMAFVPLHMENIYTPIFGMSEDIAMGLPISVEFLFVGIFILVSGIWVDRRGWHEPFIIGLALAASGGLYSWLAPDAVQFILSRALIGTGYGLTLMAAQGFIVKYSGPEGKATGLANIFAGLYAGSICGAVVGSVLAEIYGYRYVFMLGGVILIGVIGYTYLLMRGAMERPDNQLKEIGKSGKKWAMRKVARYFFDPEVIALSLFSSMPAAIAVVGFLNYFVPVYLDHMSVSESTIGQVLMIYGFSLIFMGPLVGRYIDKSKSKKKFVVFGGIVGAIAFLSFDANAGVSAAIISVILLGISSSFVLSSQSTMVLHLQVTKELGEAKALGIFRSTSRLGQVMGPIIFGGIFLASDINQVMNYFGLAYLFAVLLLVFIVKDGRDSKAADRPARDNTLSPQLKTVPTQD